MENHLTRPKTLLDSYFDRFTNEQIKHTIRTPKMMEDYAKAWNVTLPDVAEACLDCYFGRLQGTRTYVP